MKNKTKYFLTIEEKIQVIEIAIQKTKNLCFDEYLFLCNLIKRSAKDLKFLSFSHDYSTDEDLTFLKNNFSELCSIANKYIDEQLCYRIPNTIGFTDRTEFIFDENPWFHGFYKKDLKISILNELLELYKKQSLT